MVEKKDFVAATLSSNEKIFVVYIAILSVDLEIHSVCRAQLVSFLAYNVFTMISFAEFLVF